MRAAVLCVLCSACSSCRRPGRPGPHAAGAAAAAAPPKVARQGRGQGRRQEGRAVRPAEGRPGDDQVGRLRGRRQVADRLLPEPHRHRGGQGPDHSASSSRLGDDDFEAREAASEELSKSGVPAIALLRAAINAKDADPEIVRRCDLALKIIEKVPTRSLAIAAARLLATQKEDGITEVLLNYLPLADDESVGDEIRNTLAALAVRDGKPDQTLEAALESKEALQARGRRRGVRPGERQGQPWRG